MYVLHQRTVAPMHPDQQWACAVCVMDLQSVAEFSPCFVLTLFVLFLTLWISRHLNNVDQDVY